MLHLVLERYRFNRLAPVKDSVRSVGENEASILHTGLQQALNATKMGILPVFPPGLWTA